MTIIENAFLIHSAFGNPEENWLPWLKMELERIGISTAVPRFPTPEGQSLPNWTKAFQPYRNDLNESTLLVGHSIGCAFILNLLEGIDFCVPAAFLVAPFISDLGDPKFDSINNTFYREGFDWDVSDTPRAEARGFLKDL